MQYIRNIVSGKKNRLEKDGYNLDLTYITPRILAMSVPGEGLSCLYRNPINQVADYLNKTHGKDYQIYNLRGRKYDITKFKGEVFDDYEWEDHNSPSLSLLFELCHIEQYTINIIGGISKVVVIHCTAGKGRTGTIICCYLLFSGMCNSVDDALNYFNVRRFKVPGQGVNLACQKRYINYFYRLLQGEQLYPSVFWINEIRFNGNLIRPKFNMLYGCCPYLEIKNLRDYQMIYSQKNQNPQVTQFNQGGQLTMNLDGDTIISGDIQLTFRNLGYISEGKICSLTLNTAFLMNNEDIQMQRRKITLSFNAQDLDPLSVANDQRFPFGFSIEVDFVLTCKCTTQVRFENKCEECLTKLKQESDKYEMIYKVIQMHQKPNMDNSYLLLFGKKKEELPLEENSLVISFELDEEADQFEEEKQT